MFYLSASFKSESAMSLSHLARIHHGCERRIRSIASPYLVAFKDPRVTGENLDPGKHWFVVTQGLFGMRPNAFAKIEFFRRFPEEISGLPHEIARSIDWPSNLYVVSSFGLIAGLLRQRDVCHNCC